MSRKKLEIDRTDLESAIQTVESDLDNPPKNYSELFKRVSDHLNLNSPGSVAGRIKDYGLLDTLKTKPGRIFSPNGEGGRPKRKGGGLSDPNLVTIDCEPFIRRGLRVETLGDLLASSEKTDDVNSNILDAIREVRRKASLPFLSWEELNRLMDLGETDHLSPNDDPFGERHVSFNEDQ